jgi:hypothetical protein
VVWNEEIDISEYDFGRMERVSQRRKAIALSSNKKGAKQLDYVEYLRRDRLCNQFNP